MDIKWDLMGIPRISRKTLILITCSFSVLSTLDATLQIPRNQFPKRPVFPVIVPLRLQRTRQANTLRLTVSHPIPDSDANIFPSVPHAVPVHRLRGIAARCKYPGRLPDSRQDAAFPQARRVRRPSACHPEQSGLAGRCAEYAALRGLFDVGRKRQSTPARRLRVAASLSACTCHS